MRHLFWLSLLTLVGLLRFPLHYPLLGAFMGFISFTVFYKIDERDQANLGKAGLFTFVVMTFAFTFLFVTLGLYGTPVERVLTEYAHGVPFLYMLLLLSFWGSYAYFERSWETQDE